MTAEHPAEAPARITPGGNPVCPKCGRWYGPGEKHECEAPVQDVADVLANELSSWPYWIDHHGGEYDERMLDVSVDAAVHDLAVVVAPLLAAARAEGRAEVEAAVLALADEMVRPDTARTMPQLRLKERGRWAVRLRAAVSDPSVADESEEPFYCYPCARGEHRDCRRIAWQPDIRCECSHGLGDPSPPSGTPRGWQDETVPHLLTSARLLVDEIDNGCTCPDQGHQNRLHDLACDVVRTLTPGPSALADRERAAAEKALRDAADAWSRGGWSDVMLPKPTPPAVPVIAYSNRVGDWLRDRADRIAGGDNA